MPLQQWILLIAGLVVLFVGICLMAYGALAKRAYAGPRAKKSGGATADIIRALADLLKVVGDYLGANAATRVGFLFIAAGFLLIYFALRMTA